MFLGKTSSLISPFKACLLHLFLSAIATARFALFCPTTYLSNSDTISLGDNEFGSTTALPIWVDYMNSAFKKIDVDEFTLPDGISYVRINKKTGELSKSAEDESYFELFLSEDL